MPYVEMHNRNQIKMITLDTMVDTKSIARVIDSFVDSLDLEKLGFQRTRAEIEGRPAYPPREML